MKQSIQVLALLLFALVGSQPAWTQLIDNGDGTISDVDQQIMWMKDAGMAPSMTHAEAILWVQSLNSVVHLGYSDWRLPSGTDVRADTTATTDDHQYFYNATQSELGFLFYSHFGGCAGNYVMIKCVGFLTEPNDDPDLLFFEDIPLATPVPGTVYWTGMTSISNPGYIWAFSFNNGSYREHLDDGTKKFRGWAVRDAVIPVPQCNDGIDNDADGSIDIADPGCASTADDDESDDPVTQCTDGIDNDGDGLIDGEDANCCGTADDDELAHFNPGDGDLPQCSDGLDNDDDCLIDHPEDNLCARADDPSESLRCTRMFFLGWVCLQRIAWPIAIAIAFLIFGGAYAYRARKRRREDI